MDKVKIGVIGIGNMGTQHVVNLYNGKVKNAELVAICDIKQSRLDWAKKEFNNEVSTFLSIDELIDANCADALIIATPHYQHPIMGIQGLKNNLHILVEKPIGVYTKAVAELNKIASESDKVFTIMYNQRTNPIYKKVRDLVKSGEIGEFRRVNWTITDWYRTQFYYNSGGWRATWEGEGGGVLINQCPHQLDLIQWILGMPSKVRGFCNYGKLHNIEVEDEVTAYLEYPNGATGVFITSTGEAPGTNRLEIVGDKGKLVVEKNELTFYRNRISEREHNATSQEGFDKPENWECKIPVEGILTNHVGIMQNFVDAIMDNKEQLAPGVEGINGLTISNAIHLSSWTDNWVTLPLNEDLFYEKLQEKIETSTINKEDIDIVLNLQGSH
ncbi:Gfo/Idh/MocA family protein [Clostridium grantii]|uniref:Predicted dehydrogenase n=1 Tax=Clostridium grantii DSM 8605 TaxID=1121316 RepID=A0A1M5SWB9_9CLOT|nr:Gfo/Idh/MocA family oxidoreductase [Clostridium grantii]SHH42333.1 Predicted dehydrogenase [Clostridium grantii DSM 8605]